MTTAAQLLMDLQALGVTLQPHGDALRFRPRDKVMPGLLAQLRDCKVELLEMLRGGDGDKTPRTPRETSVVSPAAAGSQDAHGDAGEWLEVTDPDGWRCLVRADAAELEIIDVPTPCPNCGGIVFWWDVAGGVHCERCSPMPTTGQRLRTRAAELRERYPVIRDADLQPRPAVPRTWPPVVPDSILAAPIPRCSDCGRRAVVPGQPGRPAGLCFDCWSLATDPTGDEIENRPIDS